MAILSDSDYPEVREQLDVTLDSTMLPDATIGRDAFIGEAEREVLARDPDAATRTGDEQKRVRLAAIYLTAARLAPVLPVIVSEQFSDQRYQRQAIDPMAQVAALRQRAEDVFNAYLTPSEPAGAVPFMFGTVCGRRGR